MSKYLKKVLEEKHMSQAELGRRLGLKRNTINWYCNTKESKKIKVDKLVEFARATGVDLGEFMRGIIEDE
jgi:transcriptional regulator with XRE-family HTH domain